MGFGILVGVLLLAAYLIVLPLLKGMAGYFPWLYGPFTPLLLFSLGAAATAVGMAAVMLLRRQANRAVGAMVAAVLFILLAWAIDFGCYFDHEGRYHSKPRRHAANSVAFHTRLASARLMTRFSDDAKERNVLEMCVVRNQRKVESKCH